jgi:hypothetical protein
MIGKSMHRFHALFAVLSLASSTIVASGNAHAEQSAPAGGHEQHMMVPQAPMHEMPGQSMEHGAEAAEAGGHDMSPVDVSDAPAAGPQARGGQLRRLKDLEKENERLRRAVSDLTLDKQILTEAVDVTTRTGWSRT